MLQQTAGARIRKSSNPCELAHLATSLVAFASAKATNVAFAEASHVPLPPVSTTTACAHVAAAVAPPLSLLHVHTLLILLLLLRPLQELLLLMGEGLTGMPV